MEENREFEKSWMHSIFLDTSPENIEKAIEKAIKTEKISKKRAMCELLVFMCSYGTTENFKDYINYFITHQDDFSKNKRIR